MAGVKKDRDRPRECPFLGRRRDKGVVYSYATDSNVCHAEGSVKRRRWILTEQRPYSHVSPKRQRDTCFKPEIWATCPAYLAVKGRGPREAIPS